MALTEDKLRAIEDLERSLWRYRTPTRSILAAAAMNIASLLTEIRRLKTIERGVIALIDNGTITTAQWDAVAKGEPLIPRAHAYLLREDERGTR
jgi:hypothetical protein